MKFKSNIKSFIGGSALVAAFISNPIQAAQVTFTEIPGDITISGNVLATISVSDEGTVVFSHNFDLYKWNSSEGLVNLGDFPEIPYSWNTSYSEKPHIGANISADGQVIAFDYYSSDDIMYPLPNVGTFINYIYSEGNLQILEGLNGGLSKNISPDGTTLGGRTTTYNLTDGTQSGNYVNGLPWFGWLSKYDWGRNVHFSNDSNIFTMANQLVTIDETGTTAQEVPGMTDTVLGMGRITDLSGDGNIVVGTFKTDPSCDNVTCYANQRWDSTTDTSTIITMLLESTNYDGSIIVGASGNSGSVWDEVNGIRDITDMLSENGIDISNWTNTRLKEISTDGTYIVGYGKNPEGQLRGFLISSIPECTTGLF